MTESDPSIKVWARLARQTRTRRPSAVRLAAGGPLNSPRSHSTTWIHQNFELILAAQYLSTVKLTPNISWTRLIKLGYPHAKPHRNTLTRMSQRFWRHFLNLYHAQRLPTHQQMLDQLETITFLAHCDSTMLARPYFKPAAQVRPAKQAPLAIQPSPPTPPPDATQPTPPSNPSEAIQRKPRTIDDITSPAPPRNDVAPTDEISTYPPHIQALYYKSKELNKD